MKQIQNSLKKSDAEYMGMPLNGWSVRKCGSPEMIQSALAARASSKNRLSSGSVLAFMCSEAENVTAYRSTSFIISILSSGVKYVSNFGRQSTSRNSVIAASEIANAPRSIAFRNALSLVEFLTKNALMRALVSKTKKLRFIIQNLVQLFLRKPASGHSLLQVINKCKELSFRFFKILLPDTHTQFVAHLFFFGRWHIAPSAGHIGRYFDYYTFHSLSFCSSIAKIGNLPTQEYKSGKSERPKAPGFPTLPSSRL